MIFLKILSNSTSTKVEHYRVRYTDDNKLTVDDDTYFENLTKLVEVCDYLLSFVKTLANGLLDCCFERWPGHCVVFLG